MPLGQRKSVRPIPNRELFQDYRVTQDSVASSQSFPPSRLVEVVHRKWGAVPISTTLLQYFMGALDPYLGSARPAIPKPLSPEVQAFDVKNWIVRCGEQYAQWVVVDCGSMKARTRVKQPKVPGSTSGLEAQAFNEEKKWILENREEYAGQWVALDRGRLVKAGSKPNEVFEAARSSGVATPFVYFIEDAAKDLFVGW